MGDMGVLTPLYEPTKLIYLAFYFKIGTNRENYIHLLCSSIELKKSLISIFKNKHQILNNCSVFISSQCKKEKLNILLLLEKMK